MELFGFVLRCDEVQHFYNENLFYKTNRFYRGFEFQNIGKHDFYPLRDKETFRAFLLFDSKLKKDLFKIANKLNLIELLDCNIYSEFKVKSFLKEKKLDFTEKERKFINDAANNFFAETLETEKFIKKIKDKKEKSGKNFAKELDEEELCKLFLMCDFESDDIFNEIEFKNTKNNFIVLFNMLRIDNDIYSTPIDLYNDKGNLVCTVAFIEALGLNKNDCAKSLEESEESFKNLLIRKLKIMEIDELAKLKSKYASLPFLKKILGIEPEELSKDNDKYEVINTAVEEEKKNE